MAPIVASPRRIPLWRRDALAIVRTGIDTHALTQSIGDTRPLSVLMSEQVQALRTWVQSRTVPAS